MPLTGVGLMRGEGSGGSKRPEGLDGGTPPTANLVIRVWGEQGSPEPFRARIIEGTSEGDEHTIGYAFNREDVVAAVNRWLDRLPEFRT